MTNPYQCLVRVCTCMCECVLHVCVGLCGFVYHIQIFFAFEVSLVSGVSGQPGGGHLFCISCITNPCVPANIRCIFGSVLCVCNVYVWMCMLKYLQSHIYKCVINLRSTV